MRTLAAVLLLTALASSTARADETSTTDKLRILYSSRFTFTDDGLPLVTVQIVGAREEIELSAPGGLTLVPDGEGGSATVVDGARTWTVRAADTAPAAIR